MYPVYVLTPIYILMGFWVFSGLTWALWGAYMGLNWFMHIL